MGLTGTVPRIGIQMICVCACLQGWTMFACRSASVRAVILILHEARVMRRRRRCQRRLRRVVRSVHRWGSILVRVVAGWVSVHGSIEHVEEGLGLGTTRIPGRLL